MVKSKINKTAALSDEEIREVSEEALSEIELEGKKFLAIIPDSTRTAPLPFFFRLLDDILGRKAKNPGFLGGPGHTSSYGRGRD